MDHDEKFLLEYPFNPNLGGCGGRGGNFGGGGGGGGGGWGGNFTPPPTPVGFP